MVINDENKNDDHTQGVVVKRTVNKNGSTEALEHISDPGDNCHFLHKVGTMAVMMMTMIMMMKMMVICRMRPQWQLCPSALVRMCMASFSQGTGGYLILSIF